MARLPFPTLYFLVILAGCTDDGGSSALDDAGSPDGGPGGLDASPRVDAGAAPEDAGAPLDGGSASNSRCATATPVAPGETLSAQDIAHGGLAPRACEPPGDGPMLWYRTTVPAGAAVDVEARLVSAVDGIYPYTVMRLVQSCDVPTCEARVGSFGGLTILTLDNTAGMGPRAFDYAVTLEDDVAGSRTGGTFDLIAAAPRL